jgi:hypothetical protein
VPTPKKKKKNSCRGFECNIEQKCSVISMAIMCGVSMMSRLREGNKRLPMIKTQVM